MVSEASSKYESQWAAITSIVSKIGCTPETLRRWVRQQERDAAQRPGPTKVWSASWPIRGASRQFGNADSQKSRANC